MSSVPSSSKPQLDEQARHPTLREKLSQRVARNKKWWIGGAVVVSLLLLIIVIVAATVGGGGSSNNVWKNKSPSTQLQATHVEFCGTWNDRLVVAGAFSGDGERRSSVEVFDLDENDNWQATESFVVQEQIESMAVTDAGNRIAVAVRDSESDVRFFVFDETEGGTWNQYGEVIETEDLLVSSDASVSSFQNPIVMLSNDGKTMVLTLQAAGNNRLEQNIHVLQDANSLNGSIGEFWKRVGKPLVNPHPEDHGAFATFAALSGDGTKLSIASEENTLAVYKREGEEWQLQAEYDESPVAGTGSLALSRDGSTLAVGSYDSGLQGTGELYIINRVWPWFLVHDEDDTTTTASDADSTTSVQVSLSETGSHVLVGRFPASGTASLQVYEYIPAQHEWMSVGDGPFGQVHSSPQGAVDMSDDALHVAAAVDGQLLVYELVV